MKNKKAVGIAIVITVVLAMMVLIVSVGFLGWGKKTVEKTVPVDQRGGMITLSIITPKALCSGVSIKCEGLQVSADETKIQNYCNTYKDDTLEDQYYVDPSYKMKVNADGTPTTDPATKLFEGDDFYLPIHFSSIDAIGTQYNMYIPEHYGVVDGAFGTGKKYVEGTAMNPPSYTWLSFEEFGEELWDVSHKVRATVRNRDGDGTDELRYVPLYFWKKGEEVSYKTMCKVLIPIQMWDKEENMGVSEITVSYRNFAKAVLERGKITVTGDPTGVSYIDVGIKNEGQTVYAPTGVFLECTEGGEDYGTVHKTTKKIEGFELSGHFLSEYGDLSPNPGWISDMRTGFDRSEFRGFYNIKTEELEAGGERDIEFDITKIIPNFQGLGYEDTDLTAGTRDMKFGRYYLKAATPTSTAQSAMAYPVFLADEDNSNNEVVGMFPISSRTGSWVEPYVWKKDVPPVIKIGTDQVLYRAYTGDPPTLQIDLRDYSYEGSGASRMEYYRCCHVNDQLWWVKNIADCTSLNVIGGPTHRNAAFSECEDGDSAEGEMYKDDAGSWVSVSSWGKGMTCGNIGGKDHLFTAIESTVTNDVNRCTGQKVGDYCVPKPCFKCCQSPNIVFAEPSPYKAYRCTDDDWVDLQTDDVEGTIAKPASNCEEAAADDAEACTAKCLREEYDAGTQTGDTECDMAKWESGVLTEDPYTCECVNKMGGYSWQRTTDCTKLQGTNEYDKGWENADEYSSCESTFSCKNWCNALGYLEHAEFSLPQQNLGITKQCACTGEYSALTPADSSLEHHPFPFFYTWLVDQDEREDHVQYGPVFERVFENTGFNWCTDYTIRLQSELLYGTDNFRTDESIIVKSCEDPIVGSIDAGQYIIEGTSMRALYKYKPYKAVSKGKSIVLDGSNSAGAEPLKYKWQITRFKAVREPEFYCCNDKPDATWKDERCRYLHPEFWCRQNGVKQTCQKKCELEGYNHGEMIGRDQQIAPDNPTRCKCSLTWPWPIETIGWMESSQHVKKVQSDGFFKARLEVRDFNKRESATGTCLGENPPLGEDAWPEWIEWKEGGETRQVQCSDAGTNNRPYCNAETRQCCKYNEVEDKYYSCRNVENMYEDEEKYKIYDKDKDGVEKIGMLSGIDEMYGGEDGSSGVESFLVVDADLAITLTPRKKVYELGEEITLSAKNSEIGEDFGDYILRFIVRSRTIDIDNTLTTELIFDETVEDVNNPEVILHLPDEDGMDIIVTLALIAGENSIAKESDVNEVYITKTYLGMPAAIDKWCCDGKDLAYPWVPYDERVVGSTRHYGDQKCVEGLTCQQKCRQRGYLNGQDVTTGDVTPGIECSGRNYCKCFGLSLNCKDEEKSSSWFGDTRWYGFDCEKDQDCNYAEGEWCDFYEGKCTGKSCDDHNINLCYNWGAVVKNDIHEDECWGVGELLQEWYCKNDEVAYRTIDCANTEEACLSGVCMDKGRTCYDSDSGGRDVHLFGGLLEQMLIEGKITHGPREHTDTCYDTDGDGEDETLREWYCWKGEIKYMDTICRNSGYSKCEDGACTGRFCYETDGGKNGMEKGKTTWEAGWGEHKTDYCLDDETTLVEYYCWDGDGHEVEINCRSDEYLERYPDECKPIYDDEYDRCKPGFGVCHIWTPDPQYNDDVNQFKANCKGKNDCYWNDGAEECVVNTGTGCSFYTPTGEDDVDMFKGYCENKEGCWWDAANEECKECSEQTATFCKSSDNSCEVEQYGSCEECAGLDVATCRQKDNCEVETVYSKPREGTHLDKWECHRGALRQNPERCPTGKGCPVGAIECLPTCQDSDNAGAGDQRLVKGSASQGVKVWMDSCQDSDGDGVTETLREAACVNGYLGEVATGGLLTMRNVQCNQITINGEKYDLCQDGICVQSGAPGGAAACNDPDGIAGITTRTTATKGDRSGTDICVGNMLTEWYCSGGDDLFSAQINCVTMGYQYCLYGACTSNACVDSDGHLPGTGEMFVQGTTTLALPPGQPDKTDSCADSDGDGTDETLTEWKCQWDVLLGYITRKSHEQDCSGLVGATGLCKGGACEAGAPPGDGCGNTPACSDSDEDIGGHGMFGEVETLGHTTKGTCNEWDSCSGNFLTEWSCDGITGDLVSTEYDCTLLFNPHSGGTYTHCTAGACYPTTNWGG